MSERELQNLIQQLRDLQVQQHEELNNTIARQLREREEIIGRINTEQRPTNGNPKIPVNSPTQDSQQVVEQRRRSKFKDRDGTGLLPGDRVVVLNTTITARANDTATISGIGTLFLKLALGDGTFTNRVSRNVRLVQNE